MKMHFIKIVLVVAGLCVATTGIGEAAVSAQGKFLYLQCDFDKAYVVVGFAENPLRIVDAEFPDVELKDAKLTDHRISFSSDNRFHSHELYSRWLPDAPVADASSMQFSANRLTGVARLNFFAEYGAEAKAACKAKNKDGWWCNDAPLTDTKTGSCRKVSKRF